MPDNTLQNGTANIATDEVATLNGAASSAVHVQRVKPVYGDDGTARDVSENFPLPVAQRQFTRTASFSRVSASGLNSPFMTQLANSMTVTQSSGNLVVGAGTTPNAEFLARSTESFTGSMIFRCKSTFSQRIGNQNFFVLLADSFGDNLAMTVNSATSITITKTAHGLTAANVGQSMYIGGFAGISGCLPGRYAIASVPTADTVNFTVSGFPASGSGTADVFGWNAVRLLYNGATVTGLNFDGHREGWASGDSTLSVNNTVTGHVVQAILDGRTVRVMDMTVASSSNNNQGSSKGNRIENIPDEDVPLYVYLWAYNIATPASATTWTVGFWSVEQYPNLPVYIAGVRNDGGASSIAIKPETGVNLSVGLVAGSNTVRPEYQSNASGSLSVHIVSAVGTNSTLIKASAGRFLGGYLANTTASFKYVKLHQQSTAPTAGTGVARTLAIPPNAVVAFDCGFGYTFTTGLGMTITGGAADNDSTAVAVGDVVGDLYYV